MEPLTLDELVRRYGDAEVTLPAFSSMVAGNPKKLIPRMRRSGSFPAPTTSERTNRYRLCDLAEWWTAELTAAGGDADGSMMFLVADASPQRETVGGEQQPSTARRLQRWALERSVAECAQRHGAEATRLLIAGVGVVRSDPDLAPHLADLADCLHQRGLTDRLRRNYKDGITEIAPPDTADAPTSAHDQRFIEPLLAGRYPALAERARRQDRSTSPLPGLSATAEADAVVREIWGTWADAHGADDRVDGFCEHVDEALDQLSTSSLKISRTSPAPLNALLLTVADVRRGHRLLDPACGEGNTLIAAAHLTATREGRQTIELTGRDTDPMAWTIAKARLTMRGLRHDLGAPGPDGDTLSDALDGATFDRVVAEPTPGMWASSRWLTRCRELLTPDGLAVVELPVATLGHDAKGAPVRSNQREVDAADGHLAQILVTPRNVRTESHDPVAIWVLTAAQPDTVLLVDMTTTGTQGSLTKRRIHTVGRIASAHRQGHDIADLVLPGQVEAVTLTPQRFAQRHDYWPRNWLTDDRDRIETERLKRDALTITKGLRALVDPTAETPEQMPPGIRPDDEGRLADITTDEIRRALLRLENILSGTVTRGRRPRNRD